MKRYIIPRAIESLAISDAEIEMHTFTERSKIQENCIKNKLVFNSKKSSMKRWTKQIKYTSDIQLCTSRNKMSRTNYLPKF